MNDPTEVHVLFVLVFLAAVFAAGLAGIALMRRSRSLRRSRARDSWPKNVGPVRDSPTSGRPRNTPPAPTVGE